jgi:hypothetical protein
LTLLTIKTPEKWHSPFFASVYVAMALGVSSGFRSADGRSTAKVQALLL